MARLCGTPGCKLPDWHTGLCTPDLPTMGARSRKCARKVVWAHQKRARSSTACELGAAPDLSFVYDGIKKPRSQRCQIRVGGDYQVTQLPACSDRPAVDDGCDDFDDCDDKRGGVLIPSAKVEEEMYHSERNFGDVFRAYCKGMSLHSALHHMAHHAHDCAMYAQSRDKSLERRLAQAFDALEDLKHAAAT